MSDDEGATHFGRFVLERRIALGGMAEIHLAHSRGPMGFRKTVVLKRLLPQFARDPEFVRQFVTEAKLVSHLAHANIVQVYELGQVGAQYYITMERVSGADLGRIWTALAARQQRLPRLLALYVASEALAGLDFAHRAVAPDGVPLGVVHRDVSPSNILISWRGEVKITDFGIALIQTEARGTMRLFKGKHDYMAPEQLVSQQTDHRADIYAMGVVLAEMLLGRPLFEGRTELERLERVASADLSVLERHASAFPEPLIDVLRRSLRHDPDKRFQSARDFRHALLHQMREDEVVVDSETLAAFIRSHVQPWLRRDDDPVARPPDVERPSHLGLPTLPRGIVPGTAELTPPPLDADE
jgi:serine/threonine protein kinase